MAIFQCLANVLSLCFLVEEEKIGDHVDGELEQLQLFFDQYEFSNVYYRNIYTCTGTSLSKKFENFFFFLQDTEWMSKVFSRYCRKYIYTGYV